MIGGTRRLGTFFFEFKPLRFRPESGSHSLMAFWTGAQFGSRSLWGFENCGNSVENDASKARRAFSWFLGAWDWLDCVSEASAFCPRLGPRHERAPHPTPRTKGRLRLPSRSVPPGIRFQRPHARQLRGSFRNPPTAGAPSSGAWFQDTWRYAGSAETSAGLPR